MSVEFTPQPEERQYVAPRKGIVAFLLRSGIAKDPRQARRLLLVFFIVLIVLAAVIFLWPFIDRSRQTAGPDREHYYSEGI
jgi:hypothetical protein